MIPQIPSSNCSSISKGSTLTSVSKPSLASNYRIPKQKAKNVSNVPTSRTNHAFSVNGSSKSQLGRQCSTATATPQAIASPQAQSGPVPTKRSSDCPTNAVAPPFKKPKTPHVTDKTLNYINSSKLPLPSSNVDYDSNVAPTQAETEASTSVSGSSSAATSSSSTGVAPAPPVPTILVHDDKSARFIKALADTPFESPFLPVGYSGVVFFYDSKSVLLAQVEAAIRPRVRQSLWQHIGSTLLTHVRDARPLSTRTFGVLEGHTLLPLNSLLDTLAGIEEAFTIKF